MRCLGSRKPGRFRVLLLRPRVPALGTHQRAKPTRLRSVERNRRVGRRHLRRDATLKGRRHNKERARGCIKLVRSVRATSRCRTYDHVDADVKLPQPPPAMAVAASASSSSGAAPPAAAVVQPVDPTDPTADMSELSLHKEEMVPHAAQRMQQAYEMEGYKGDFDLNLLSRDLVAMTAIEPQLPKRKCTGAWCDSHGIKPAFMVDLTAPKADGTFWDLSAQKEVDLLTRLLRTEKPTLLVVSPPSSLYEDLRYREPQRETAPKVRAAWKYLQATLAACKLQLSAGRHFLMELPTGSGGWREQDVREFARMSGVTFTTSQKIGWRLAHDAEDVHIRRVMRWVTSAPGLMEILRKSEVLDRQVHELEG